MTPDPEQLAELEAALKAGPTPGPRRMSTILSASENDRGWRIFSDSTHAPLGDVFPMNNARGDASPQAMANAALAAACNPALLSALLAERKEAERYRWLRDEWSLTWVPFQSQWRMTAAECDAAIDNEIARTATLDAASKGQQP